MFYVRLDGITYGPYTEETLRGYIAEGRIIPESELSLDGENWHQAGEIPGLFSPSGVNFGRLPETAIGGAVPMARKSSFFGDYIDCWEKYGSIKGRARRREYFAWFLFNTIILFLIVMVSLAIAKRNGVDITVLQHLSMAAPEEMFELIRPLAPYFLPLMAYALISLLPSIAVAVRRLHDMNLSGWWYLLLLVISRVPAVGSIAGLLMFLIPGTASDNRFGPNPRG